MSIYKPENKQEHLMLKQAKERLNKKMKTGKITIEEMKELRKLNKC